MRRIAITALLLLAAGLLVALPAAGDDDGPYRIRAIFDNGGFIVEGEEVRIAGASSEGEAPALTARLRDLRGTVTAYLQEHLEGASKERALAIATRLVEEQEQREALSPDIA